MKAVWNRKAHHWKRRYLAGESIPQIAQDYQINHGIVCSWLKKLGVPIRTDKERAELREKEMKSFYEGIVKEYQTTSVNDLAAKYKVSDQCIYDWFEMGGGKIIPRQERGLAGYGPHGVMPVVNFDAVNTKPKRGRSIDLTSYKFVYERLHQGKTYEKIAEELKMTRQAVEQKVRRLQGWHHEQLNKVG